MVSTVNTQSKASLTGAYFRNAALFRGVELVHKFNLFLTLVKYFNIQVFCSNIKMGRILKILTNNFT